MKKIKILEAIRQGQIGGGESHVLDLCSNIDTSKYTPVVLSFTEGPMVDLLNKKGIRTRVIPTDKAFDFNVWQKVHEFIQKEDIDIVHAHGTRAMSNVFKPTRRLKLPLIYTVHGWSFHANQNPLIRKARELSEKFLTSKASLTICVSRSNQNDGIKRFRMKRSTVIYNAVNLERFNPNLQFKNLRTEFNIGPEKTLIGYIVRITGQKDPFTMVKAMKLVAEEEKDIILLMVGDGDLKQDVVDWVKEMGVEESVIFQPFRTDIPDVLNATDIYCLPSLWEGFPIGILEAMAMKKVVISTPVDGNAEIVESGKTGLLVPVGQHEQLAEQILRMHRDKKLRESIAQRGYDMVVQGFSVDRLMAEIENVYKTYH
jgi:glycosyltransferase involved in cell wall biosynthesis